MFYILDVYYEKFYLIPRVQDSIARRKSGKIA